MNLNAGVAVSVGQNRQIHVTVNGASVDQSQFSVASAAPAIATCSPNSQGFTINGISQGSTMIAFTLNGSGGLVTETLPVVVVPFLSFDFTDGPAA